MSAEAVHGLTTAAGALEHGGDRARGAAQRWRELATRDGADVIVACATHPC